MPSSAKTATATRLRQAGEELRKPNGLLDALRRRRLAVFLPQGGSLCGPVGSPVPISLARFH